MRGDEEEIRSRIDENDAFLVEAGRILKCHPKQVFDRIRKMSEALDKVSKLLDDLEKDRP